MKQGQATPRDDGKWDVEHPDGSTEVLTDKEFHQQFEVEGETPDDKPVESTPQQVRPQTSDGEVFTAPVDWVKKYIEEVEEELKAYEIGIKAVRDEISAVKKLKKGDRFSFGPLRHAIHELSHGNPLTRTAHTITVPHDGAESLQQAPVDAVCSGPGEEDNMVRHAGR
jgi:hypothetical protein